MTLNGFSRAVDHGRKIEFGIGTPLKVHIQGMLKSIKGTFVGMHPHHYVIVEIPKLFPANNMKGHDVTVRYLQSGTVYGFTSFIMWHVRDKNFDIIFLFYPMDIEIYELRKHTRVQCYLPAEITTMDTNINGIISDIGIGGCRLILNSADDFRLEVGQQVKIKCQTFTISDNQYISCTIRSVSDDTSNLQIGLQFIDVEPEIKEDIEEYVESVSEIVSGLPNKT